MIWYIIIINTETRLKITPEDIDLNEPLSQVCQAWQSH